MIVFSLLTKYMTYEVAIGQLVMFAPSVCSIGVLRITPPSEMKVRTISFQSRQTYTSSVHACY